MLPPTIRCTDVAAVGIDPHITRLDAFGRFHCRGEVVGENSRRETDAIDVREHLFVGVPNHHRHNRAEYLLAADPHRRRHLVEDRRRDEQSDGELLVAGHGGPAAEQRARLKKARDAAQAVLDKAAYDRAVDRAHGLIRAPK